MTIIASSIISLPTEIRLEIYGFCLNAYEVKTHAQDPEIYRIQSFVGL